MLTLAATSRTLRGDSVSIICMTRRRRASRNVVAHTGTIFAAIPLPGSDFFRLDDRDIRRSFESSNHGVALKKAGLPQAPLDSWRIHELSRGTARRSRNLELPPGLHRNSQDHTRLRALIPCLAVPVRV